MLHTVTAIFTRGCKLKGDFVLIIVVPVVAAKAHEHGKLVVGQVSSILLEGIGVDEHLNALVLAQVESGVLINGLGLARREVVDNEAQRLLVLLGKLRLGRILLTGDSRRQDVVHRRLVVVLLDVHRADGHASALVGRGVERLLVGAPFSAHKVERGETQYDRFLEVSEEHAHEAD